MPMYCNAGVDLMSPQDFLRAPLAWLKKLSDISATMTAAPNFALERCCDVAKPETIKDLDLSSLRCLLTGSEPVNPQTLERFPKPLPLRAFSMTHFCLPMPGGSNVAGNWHLKARHRPNLSATRCKSAVRKQNRDSTWQPQSCTARGNGQSHGMAQIADPETRLPLADWQHRRNLASRSGHR